MHSRSLILAVAAAACLLAVPAVASAHDGHDHAGDVELVQVLGADAVAVLPGDSPARIPTAAEARADLALRSSKDSRTLECRETVDVPGQGESCRLADGGWRINLEDGGSMVSHGPDFVGVDVPAAGGEPAPASVASPSVSDVTCVPRNSARPHFQAVYAYPSNGVARTGTVVAALRTEVYRMSAVIAARAAEQSGSTVDRKLVVACTAGELDVQVYQLPTSTANDDFSSIKSDLATLGEWSTGAAVNVLAFYDAGVSPGVAGQGNFPDDDRLSTANYVRSGGRLAVQYAFYGGAMPVWSTLLHEAGHNMGAVVEDAPHSSGAAHCNDGIDVMCYDDGGPTANYTSTSCAVETWDCGGDTYFNVSPVPLSWLATHWNLASDLNWFLDSTGGVTDSVAPTAPTGLHMTMKSPGLMRLAWEDSTDDRGVVAYKISRSVAGGPMTFVQYGQGVAAWVDSHMTAGVEYTYEIRATDGVNESPAATFTTHGFEGNQPTEPGNLRVTGTTSTTASLAWDAASDDRLVTGYVVQWFDDGAWQQAQVAGTTYTVTGLGPTELHWLYVRAVDDDLLWGDSTAVLQRMPNDASDVSAPTAPGAVRVDAARTRISLEWGASTDNRRVAGYRVTRTPDGGAPVQVADLAAEETGWTDTTAAVDTMYTYAVVAHDEFNTSAPATARARLMDLTSPSMPARSRTEAVGATTIDFAWDAATDNYGVAGYEVWLNVRDTWRVVGETTALSYRLTGLTPGTTYYLSVAAFDQDGNRSSSETVLATTAGGTTAAPVSPTAWKQLGKVSFKRVGANVRMSWAPPADAKAQVRRYEVFEKRGKRWVKLGQSTTSPFLLKTVSRGVKHTYGIVVRHVDGRVSSRMTSTFRG